MNHAANRRRVLELNRVVDPAQTHAFDDVGLFRSNPIAFHERHLDALRVGDFFAAFFAILEFVYSCLRVVT
jgi:hypothetical protein